MWSSYIVYLQANMDSRVGLETTDRTHLKKPTVKLLVACWSLAGWHVCRWPKVSTETHGRLAND